MNEKRYLRDNIKLMKEWNYEKNKLLNPNELTSGSPKNVWWICEKKHEWQDTINHRSSGKRNCPYCSNHRILIGYNDLFTTNPELEKEWDYKKNIEINPKEISNGSHKKAWWICEKKHSYYAEIRGRIAGYGCPYCSNMKILVGYNDLFTTNPELEKEWDYEKNVNVNPQKISASYKNKVWWKCSKGHNWQTAVINRTNKGSGCLYCSNRMLLKGYNDFATLHPELLKEWDYDKNINLNPNDILSSCKEKVWWKCSKNHEWKSEISSRVYNRTKCPICSSQKVLKGYNDLASLNPELLKEWNYEKNKNLKPDEITHKSGQKVWWKCHKCGFEWKSTPYNRNNSQGCPKCNSGLRYSFPEKCIYYYCKKFFNDTKANEKLEFLKGKELDIYIPSLNIGIEYDGKKWHTSDLKDNKKDMLCIKNKCKLIRVREEKCENESKEIIYFYLDNDKIFQLEDIIKKILILLGIREEKIDINIERDRIKIYETLELSLKENSLLVKEPEIAKEWNYKKNGNLKPEQFSCGSEKNVWWICPKGHEYDMKINMKTSGKLKCPICSNNRVLKGYNDLATTHPQLLKEWDYDKNIIRPDEIFAGSEIIVHWKCEKGHEWESYAYKRKNGKNNCPYCSNDRVLKGYNDLETVNPNLAKEWNYEKNYPLVPNMFVAGSNQVVWWKCSVCEHEWKTQINYRNGGRGCKKCASKRLSEIKKNELLIKNGSLKEKNPELAKEWNYEKNKDLTPEKVTSNTNLKVWWIGKCGHEWMASIHNRNSKGSGCPICNNKRVKNKDVMKILLEKNSIEAFSKELAKEWNEKNNNGLKAKDIMSGSGKKYWWKCSICNYEWEATPNNRKNGRGCPNCFKNKRKNIK